MFFSLFYFNFPFYNKIIYFLLKAIYLFCEQLNMAELGFTYSELTKQLVIVDNKKMVKHNNYTFRSLIFYGYAGNKFIFVNFFFK